MSRRPRAGTPRNRDSIAKTHACNPTRARFLRTDGSRPHPPNDQLLIDTLDAVIQQLIHDAAWDCAHGRVAVCAIVLRIQTKRADRALSMHSVFETPNNERMPGAAAAPRRKNDIVSVFALLGTHIQSFRSLRKSGLARSTITSERPWNRPSFHVRALDPPSHLH